MSLRLARLLAARPNTTVTSIFRNPDHTSDIQETGAKPLVLSLEDASVSQLADAFKSAKADVVYFSAGAGGKGGSDRTKKVDEEGAIKAFDAIESLGGSVEERPRLILVSAIDTRDTSKGYPSYYVSILLFNTSPLGIFYT